MEDSPLMFTNIKRPTQEELLKKQEKEKVATRLFQEKTIGKFIDEDLATTTKVLKKIETSVAELHEKGIELNEECESILNKFQSETDISKYQQYLSDIDSDFTTLKKYFKANGVEPKESSGNAPETIQEPRENTDFETMYKKKRLFEIKDNIDMCAGDVDSNESVLKYQAHLVSKELHELGAATGKQGDPLFEAFHVASRIENDRGQGIGAMQSRMREISDLIEKCMEE